MVTGNVDLDDGGLVVEVPRETWALGTRGRQSHRLF